MGLLSKLKKIKIGKAIAGAVKTILPVTAPIVNAASSAVKAAGNIVKGAQSPAQASQAFQLEQQRANAPPNSFNWKLWGGIAAAVVVVVIVAKG